MSGGSDIAFSLVVPTYNRPETLKETLASALKMSAMPKEVLVIDDGDLSLDSRSFFEDAFAKRGAAFTYHKKDHNKIRRGLSESKNAAATLASGDVVCFVDDDVILEPEYIDALARVWKEHWHDDTLMGVGGKAKNGRRIYWPERIHRKLFGLSGACAWDVNDVGFQVWDTSVVTTERGFYLEGCSSSYRRALLQKMPFATFAGGRTALEDVEHCLRAKKEGFHFLYAPSVRLLHLHAPMSRDAAYAAGKKESRNRKIIFKSLCPQDRYHRAWFVWAQIGWILKKLFVFKIREAGGMMSELFSLTVT